MYSAGDGDLTGAVHVLKFHSSLAALKSGMVSIAGTGIPRLCWNTGILAIK